jgi:ribokinase
MVAVEAGGENRIVVISGANGAVAEQHIEQEREAIAAADWLLLQLEIPLATNIAAAQVAHEVGTRVLLNPAPVPADGLPAELLADVDLLVPNEGEALRLTAASTPEEAAKMLCAGGIETIIVTLGAEGELLADKDGLRQIAAFEVDAVDTTAAGDAFVGALAAALSFGKTIEQAVTYGAAAGALAVTKLGAQPSLPTLQAVEGVIAMGK